MAAVVAELTLHGFIATLGTPDSLTGKIAYCVEKFEGH
jgi:hypothetical protein